MVGITVRYGFLSLGLLFAALSAPAAPGSELQQHKAVVRRLFEEALSQAKWEVFLEIHEKDYVAHAGSRTATLAEDIESAKEWHQAVPDAACTVGQLVAEGDLVTASWTCRGTNSGTGHGLPATGKAIAISGITIFRVKDGKLAEEWGITDMWGLLKQLGLAPSLK
jgi:steroid delta-isomerase-like uncharacterized protein